ncbi:binding-protein-dependent transport systems inner membrane component [Thermoclostridium stercorarium subsp. stercorarium DSM 8532]|uniref:Binding-protein-dependent transport systems inner membrane component n=3 Tax=Thermoclostridium stercorarium TaxID=1510 RepID=L7VQN1_THES1|nr:ABC transporter permease subunit [Thermoclostridium stercorarium]AGC67883.1 binding-protein-dependent transport systems inner membrane component [Thermoclostridium stercorarium subsp. stercorarium DSM 8532]AGI38924.1 ABC transporter permease subunit [Thermoclostridium stercorarium subsp. stercorarium DSM 8532]UZQ86431.1 ABC transporter permease subunit [Thermoclostridium stercorarium]
MATSKTVSKKEFWKLARKQKSLILISIPFFIYFFIFNYLPLWGLTLAFQNYKPYHKFWEQEWVGLLHFKNLFTDPDFYRVMRNTIGMSLINLALGFITAIIFALLLNELTGNLYHFKRVVQTISYMPHFLSWIIVCGLVSNILSMDDGILNEILLRSGLIKEKIHFLGKPEYFWWIVGFTNVWKSMGWNSIIYLAAITSIDPCLYEAAAIDGYGRFGRMWHVTLPGIKSTIIVLLIMNAGWILNAGFEMQYILGSNGLVLDVSETIDIFVLKRGFGRSGGFSFGTAAGMFKTVVSTIILLLCNKIAALLDEERLV